MRVRSGLLLALAAMAVFACYAIPVSAECVEVNGQVRCTDESTVTADSGYSYDSLRRSMYFVLATILQIAGLAAVVAVVFYGARMALAGGDAAKFSEAKKSLLFALLGAVVIFGIYTILATVRGAVDSATGRKGGQQEIQTLPLGRQLNDLVK